MDFGIDFGTTNSACVGIEDGCRVKKFGDDSGNPFPSLVIIDRTTGRVYCGRDAWRRREELVESCEVITSVKTLLNSDMVWNIAGRTWKPEMVAAQVFGALKDRVERRMGEDALKEAVVALPVGFSTGKRAALRKAAKQAGIEIKSFVSEPTAALFSHYQEVGQYTRIGVFDWGGGTLDISIIENRNGRVKELGTAGLGIAGDYIDRLMAEWMHNRIIKKANRKMSFSEMSPEDRDKMLFYCEQAKRDLTWDDPAEIYFPSYGDLGEVHESIDFEDFSGLIEPVVDKAIRCFEDCIRRAGMSMTQLDCVLMVGGSVNLKPLSERVANDWNGKECYPEDSDWSVARGTASLSVSPGQYLLAQNVGLVMSDGSLHFLMNEGKPVVINGPVTATFALVEDERVANLIFSDGDGQMLGSLDVPAFGFFREKIDVRAHVDPDLTLRIEAKSMNRSSCTTTEWNYDFLRLDYELPNRLEMLDDE